MCNGYDASGRVVGNPEAIITPLLRQRYALVAAYQVFLWGYCRAKLVCCYRVGWVRQLTKSGDNKGTIRADMRYLAILEYAGQLLTPFFPRRLKTALPTPEPISLARRLEQRTAWRRYRGSCESSTLLGSRLPTVTFTLLCATESLVQFNDMLGPNGICIGKDQQCRFLESLDLR